MNNGYSYTIMIFVEVQALEIRKTTAKDTVSLEKLWSICFMGSMNVQDAERNAQENPCPPKGWGAYEDDQLVAGMVGNELTMNFYGEKAPLLGIGGVVTHPSYRKSGAIRQIMKSVLTDARSRGFVFSGLYPFNFGFYRKFGYELSKDLYTFTLPIKCISSYASDLKTRMLEENDERSILMPVYNAFAARYNLSIERDLKALSRYTSSNPYAKNDYTYAIYEGDDVCAYIAFSKAERDGENVMRIRDYAFKKESDFLKILAFIARFTAEFSSFEIELPPDVPISMLSDNPYDVKVKQSANYMMRVLNAEKALGLLKGFASGSFVIEITDDFLPENSGKYQVDQNGCTKTNEDADITMSVQAFSQMLCGYEGLTGTLFRKDVVLHKNRDTLETVFKKQPSFTGLFF